MDSTDSIEKSQEKLANQTHYTKCKIEPLDFIEANGLSFSEGNVVKYISRYKRKNGLEDLIKARVYLDRVIARVKRETPREDQLEIGRNAMLNEQDYKGCLVATIPRV